METDEPLYDRLVALKPADLSLHAWASRAGVSRQVFSDIRRRGNAKHDTLQKLLRAVGRTLSDFDEALADLEAPTDMAKTPIKAFRAPDRPRDVPILGTAECAEMEFEGDNATVRSGTMRLIPTEVIDHARRPISLDGRDDVYAIYFAGDSMTPRYEPGELAYVDPRRAPAIGAYVIVQLRGEDSGEEKVVTVLAKRLVRRSATFIELEQFNPPTTFRVPKAQVAHIHRIFPWEELVAF